MSSAPNDPPLQREDRIGLSAEVGVRRCGLHPFRVRVFDLSREGCKIGALRPESFLGC